MSLSVEQFMCRTDNFGVLVNDPESGETLVIDAPELAPIEAAIERTGWKPTRLLITHHHSDHVEGNLGLKRRYGLRIYGPAKEKDKIPGIDETYEEGDSVAFGRHAVEVVDTPGHTAGHISLHIPTAGIGFTGDTLFALGCGRLLECKPDVMFQSLEKLKAWPAETRIYCGHEYTLANARFALTIDPDNRALQRRADEIEQLRASDSPTLPTTIGDELATNPFLRTADPAIRDRLGMADASDADVFAEIRRRKDAF